MQCELPMRLKVVHVQLERWEIELFMLQLMVIQTLQFILPDNAFKKTYFENISEMLMAMYYLYHNSPKRLRQFKELADILVEQVKLPQKAHGTRWVQHKQRAILSFIGDFPVIVAHLENMIADEATPVSTEKTSWKAT